jgi:hypothetical protein
VKTLYVKNRREWRAWLQKNFASSDEIWIVHYKKESGKPSIAYDDVVEEALCFGWIDGKVRKIDESRYARRLTPRRPGSAWAPSNVRRVRRLIAQEAMMQAGLEAFDPKKRRETQPLPAALPAELERRFKSNREGGETSSASHRVTGACRSGGSRARRGKRRASRDCSVSSNTPRETNASGTYERPPQMLLAGVKSRAQVTMLA